MADAGAPMVVTVDAARGVVALRRAAWFCDMPMADLPRWLALYRELQDREKGRFARFYAQPVAALEAAARQVRGVV